MGVFCLLLNMNVGSKEGGNVSLGSSKLPVAPPALYTATATLPSSMPARAGAAAFCREGAGGRKGWGTVLASYASAMGSFHWLHPYISHLDSRAMICHFPVKMI